MGECLATLILSLQLQVPLADASRIKTYTRVVTIALTIFIHPDPVRFVDCHTEIPHEIDIPSVSETEYVSFALNDTCYR